ncbi:flagellar hook-basal body complex protein [Arcobacter arenosus]|jgi:flagellar hook protein FlgE|uniref:flagellar hook-basal body complex protein n=1 Tax=Arcobacter arenosus TaxID=2576037 RepID=UPI003BA9BD50
MISGLWNGVTGLNTFERALNTQSNNVTNSNTIAHKKDDVSFEDLMYQSRYGNGVQIQNVEKNFQQGNLKVTNNTLDVAIDGQGFFIVNDVKTGETLYTRAGNFKMGTDGTLQTAYGDKIYGSPTTFSSIVSTDGTQTYNNNYTKFIATEPINGVGFSRTINAKATDYTLTAVDTGVSGQGFKSSSALLNDIRELSAEYNVQLDLYSANPVDGTSSTSQVTQVSFSDFSTELTSGYVEIYINNDSIKQPFETDAQTTMNLFADKISNVAGMSATVDSSGLLTISSLIPGRDNRITGAAINSNGYGINEIVSPVSGTGYAAVNSVRDALRDAIVAAGGEFLEVTNTINDAGPTLAGIGELQLKLDDLNISENVFGVLSIEDGLIYAKDQDNKFLIGKLETVTFQNPESLEPKGETLYTIGKDTGDPYNADNLNTLTGGSIELSNTNFSESLVDLMVYQRAFEASSKSVTTSDEFLRTAIEMKK